MLRRTLDYVTHLPRHPFKLAVQLVRSTPPGGKLTLAPQQAVVLIFHPQTEVVTQWLRAGERAGWHVLACRKASQLDILGAALPTRLIIIGLPAPNFSALSTLQAMRSHPATAAIPHLLSMPRQIANDPARYQPDHVIHEPHTARDLIARAQQILADAPPPRAKPHSSPSQIAHLLREYTVDPRQPSATR